MVAELGPPRRAAARWTDLGPRALSASILAPLTLGCIWYGGLPYALLVAAAGVGLAIEWVWLCGARPSRPPGLLVPLFVLLGAVVVVSAAATAVLLVLAGFVLVWALARRALLPAGIVYIGLPVVALMWLRFDVGAGRANVLFLVLVVWASDIGAYTAGRVFGGPKLAPLLSPSKTWSGAAGGLVAVVCVGLLAAWLRGQGGWFTAALSAALLGLVTQAGDLLESAIKRHVGVKDSGRLIPGHGGLLDRLDGLLLAASVAALAMLAGREGYLWQ